MYYRKAARRHPKCFPAPGAYVTNVRAEAEWDNESRRDAHLHLESKNESLNLHLYCNSGSKNFKAIIESIAKGANYRLYDVNLRLDPPESGGAEWSREAAMELLVSDKTKFSFISGAINGYGTVAAAFYAYKDEERMGGVIVKLHMIVTTDMSFGTPNEVFSIRH
jgi:hypothetical protein